MFCFVFALLICIVLSCVLSVYVQSYGLSIDRILAWRYKGGQPSVHHTGDGSITAGGSASKAPFESGQEHLHIHKPDNTKDPDATETVPSGTADLSGSATKKGVIEFGSESTKKRAIAVLASIPTALSASAAVAAAAAASAAAAAESVQHLEGSGGIKQTSSRKKSASKAAAKDGNSDLPSTAAASMKVRGRKRKGGESKSTDMDPSTINVIPSTNTRGVRRPKFLPVSKEEALAAFQRTLIAARQSAGMADVPMTGIFASKKERISNVEADESSEESETEVHPPTPAPIVPSDEEDEDGKSGSASDGGSESGTEDEELLVTGVVGGSDESDRPSKRRRTIKGKTSSRKKKTKKNKKSGKAARGPSVTAIRNALIHEHGTKEFFVTLRNRSYLHAKWVDIYAFLPPPKSRLHEKRPARSAPMILGVGLPSEIAPSPNAGEEEHNTATLTQLRVKFLRFIKSTPLPIADDEEVFLPDFVEIDRILARKMERVVESDSDDERNGTARKRGGGRKRPSTVNADEDASSSSSRAASPVPATSASASASAAVVDASAPPRGRNMKSLVVKGIGRNKRGSPTLATFYLIKWQGLPYSSCTWEHSKFVHDDSKVAEFEYRQRLPSKARPELFGVSAPQPRPPPSAWMDNKCKMSYPDNMPQYKNGNELRPWQCDSVNWLNYNWYQRRGCILADEMGLGKTVTVVAHLLHLRAAYTRGPYLIIVPLSTLAHWKREFDAWSNLNAVVFQGSKSDRDMVKIFEWNFWQNEGADFDGKLALGAAASEYKFDALLCTYESILSDATFLAKVPWRAVVVDEAHRLKNRDSRLFKALEQFHFEHRVLMTGTPIQNNLVELWTLLFFVDPTVFASQEEFNAQFGVLEKNEQVKLLQEKLSPYLLRRMKEDVAKKIPPKEETVIQVELTILQKQYYRAVYGMNISPHIYIRLVPNSHCHLCAYS
jgi:hypothetical protein